MTPLLKLLLCTYQCLAPGLGGRATQGELIVNTGSVGREFDRSERPQGGEIWQASILNN